MLISLLLYLRQTSTPQIHIRVPDPADLNRKFADTRPGLPECPQVRVIRIDGSLFFGAVNTFQETLRGYEDCAPESKHLLIVMQAVNFIDVAGAEALVAMARRYRARGGGLYLIRPKDRVVELLERGQYMDEIGRENVFRLEDDRFADGLPLSGLQYLPQLRAKGFRGMRAAGQAGA